VEASNDAKNRDADHRAVMAARAAAACAYRGQSGAAEFASYFSAETLRYSPDASDTLEAEIAWFHNKLLNRIEVALLVNPKPKFL